MSDSTKMTAKIFFNKVVAGTALGIMVGLIPNAVLGSILKYFPQTNFITLLSQTIVIFQVTAPLLIGVLIALQFELNPMQTAVVAGACFVGSGVTTYNPELGVYLSAGTGDLINTMLTAAITILIIFLVSDRFGSLNIILSPILIGAGSGLIGLLILPYTKCITTVIGNGINSFTTLQPILMSILIACAFSIIIISPMSTTAIGLAIQLNGISAGAAAMGVAATTVVLVVHSYKVNKSGVTMAIALGAIKMMIPNLFRYPIILVPTLFTACLSAIPVAIFNVMGVPSSAGFGLVGLVGPLASIDAGLNLLTAIVVWFVIPIISALLSLLIFEKGLKLYKKEEAFAYLG